MIIKPAKRTESVKEYYFSKKLREIAAMNAAGADIINLGIGSPDMPPHTSVVETLAESAKNSKSHGYQSYQGIPELRGAFADWYKRYYNVELNPQNEIQLLAGSKEGILLLSLAFIDEGDGVLVPNPGYPTYTSASALTGANIISYDLMEDNDWQPDFEALEKMDLSNVKLMWVNYPNMPTGAKATMELYKKLVDFGRRHSILICNDNPYSFILTDEHLSILAVPGAKDCCIELNSLSKAQNMAGWRIGMIAGDAEIISTFLKVKSNQDSGMFKAMQLAAVHALAQDDDWYTKLNEMYSERRVLAGKIFDILGAKYNHASGGMFLWGKVNDSWPNGEAVSDFVLDKAKVFITPGFIFGSNGERYIRISLCAPKEVLSAAYDRILNSLQSNNR